MRILFQGDSITDAGRPRTSGADLIGYSYYTAELLGDGHEYFNRGISGNRVNELLDRYDEDFKAIEPDVVTLLIGINDVWRGFDSGCYKSPEQYERELDELLNRLKTDFPSVKIVVMEPFLLPAEDKKYWRGTLAQFIEAARNIAVKYADAFIPLDGLFAKERLVTPWQELSADGVHPAEKGQRLIAKYLAEAIKNIIE